MLVFVVACSSLSMGIVWATAADSSNVLWYSPPAAVTIFAQDRKHADVVAPSNKILGDDLLFGSVQKNFGTGGSRPRVNRQAPLSLPGLDYVPAIFALRLGNENHPLLFRDADSDFSKTLPQSDRDMMCYCKMDRR